MAKRKNKILKATGRIAAIVDVISICAIDSAWIGFSIIAIICTVYLILLSWANDWWY